MSEQIGINLWNWVNRSAEITPDLIRHVASLGFKVIEIPLTDPLIDPGVEGAALARTIEAQDLRVSTCLSPPQGYDIGATDPEERARAIAYLEHAITTSAELHAEVMVGPFFASGGKRIWLEKDEREELLAVVAGNLAQLAEFAQSQGVRLAIEPVNRYRTSIVNTAEQALALVAKAAHPNLGILYDTYQANIEETHVTQGLRKILDEGKLFHFHACENNRNIPGEGQIHWPEILGLLEQKKYEGFLTMELFKPGGLDAGWAYEDRTRDEIARQGLENLRSLLADVVMSS